MFCYCSVEANKAPIVLSFFQNLIVYCNDHDVIIRILTSQSADREVSWIVQIEGVEDFSDGSKLQIQVSPFVSKSFYTSCVCARLVFPQSF